MLEELKQLVYEEFIEIPHKACPVGLLGGDSCVFSSLSEF